MAEQSNNPVGCLGRVVTFFGVAWLLIVVLLAFRPQGLFGIQKRREI